MICDKCIHSPVCCDEGKDEGLTFCADFMEERPQGKWTITNRNLKCSNCGNSVYNAGMLVFPYCPNCGAKMGPVKKNAQIN